MLLATLDTALYFGCRSKGQDMYFAEEMETWKKHGVHVRVACSRDQVRPQEQKVIERTRSTLLLRFSGRQDLRADSNQGGFGADKRLDSQAKWQCLHIRASSGCACLSELV